MRNNDNPNDLKVGAFAHLLGFLDKDRDEATRKYEKIRLRLVKLFVCRGCHEADLLADETIDRVTAKADSLMETGYVGDPVKYFYAVARNVHLEWLRQQQRFSKEPLDENIPTAETAPDADNECLRSCLSRLPEKLRELIIEYYGADKKEKIESRRMLARKHNTTQNALQIKVSRIKQQLQKCVFACIER